jgi:hypothetical protein
VQPNYTFTRKTIQNMARFKDFGSGGDASEKEPISFKLWGEEFHCVPVIQGKLLLEIVSDSTSDDTSKSAQVMEKFFTAVLKPESKKAFDAILSDQEKITSLETLSEIVAWLMEEYSNRPNERSLAS